MNEILGRGLEYADWITGFSAGLFLGFFVLLVATAFRGTDRIMTTCGDATFD
jgi:hypothetical protein